MRGTYKYHSLDVVDDNTASLGRRPSKKFGTVVSWEDCPVDVFLSKWLPEFDRQNGIYAPAPKGLYRTIQKPAEKPQAKHRRPVPVAAKPKRVGVKPPKSDCYHQILGLLKVSPLTVGELKQRLKLGSTSTAQQILKANPEVFKVVGEKPVGKNPYTAVWGLVKEEVKA